MTSVTVRENFCWMRGEPCFSRQITSLSDSFHYILKNKKICMWEVLIISHIGSNWYMDTGVCDLELASSKANST